MIEQNINPEDAELVDEAGVDDFQDDEWLDGGADEQDEYYEYDDEEFESVEQHEDVRKYEKIKSKIDGIYEGASLFDGQKVSVVHAKGADYVIYTANRRVCWYWEFYDEVVDEGLLELQALSEVARRKFKSVPRLALDRILAGTLRTIFQSRKKEKIQHALSMYEKAIESDEGVRSVITRGKDYAVWINDEGVCAYTHFGLANVSESENEFGRIQSLAKAMLPEEHKEKIQHRLAVSMAAALRKNSGPIDAEVFRPIEMLIHKLAENKLKLQYIVATTISAILLTLIAWGVYECEFLPGLIQASLVTTAGGFVGTLISVLERSKELRLSEYESSELIILQGVLRVCLGGVFGFIAYLAAMSGLAFSLFKDAMPMLIIIGVAVGFSERLIPDLIQGITSSKDG
ncbi:hypothetical protein P2Q70_23400 [Pseudomonas mendocina]|uniref:hypothetical protein n=1 Tax=Ectopseudomonas mendocina TaxID=300 RepID=UPI0023D9E565|nr:hypothetical protein [Pseudomonas mendocina]MDF2077543.1 hypothetical protein [Pseudomonas mendocina]